MVRKEWLQLWRVGPRRAPPKPGRGWGDKTPRKYIARISNMIYKYFEGLLSQSMDEILKSKISHQFEK
jgi:hypothetical protein